MQSISTYMETDKLKTKLIDLKAEYNEALKDDKPFHLYTQGF